MNQGRAIARRTHRKLRGTARRGGTDKWQHLNRDLARATRPWPTEDSTVSRPKSAKNPAKCRPPLLPFQLQLAVVGGAELVIDPCWDEIEDKETADIWRGIIQ